MEKCSSFRNVYLSSFPCGTLKGRKTVSLTQSVESFKRWRGITALLKEDRREKTVYLQQIFLNTNRLNHLCLQCAAYKLLKLLPRKHLLPEARCSWSLRERRYVRFTCCSDFLIKCILSLMVLWIDSPFLRLHVFSHGIGEVVFLHFACKLNRNYTC